MSFDFLDLSQFAIVFVLKYRTFFAANRLSTVFDNCYRYCFCCLEFIFLITSRLGDFYFLHLLLINFIRSFISDFSSLLFFSFMTKFKVFTVCSSIITDCSTAYSFVTITVQNETSKKYDFWKLCASKEELSGSHLSW